jgi:protein tyrosine/serine phosphatase
MVNSRIQEEKIKDASTCLAEPKIKKIFKEKRGDDKNTESNFKALSLAKSGKCYLIKINDNSTSVYPIEQIRNTCILRGINK